MIVYVWRALPGPEPDAVSLRVLVLRRAAYRRLRDWLAGGPAAIVRVDSRVGDACMSVALGRPIACSPLDGNFERFLGDHPEVPA